MPKILIYLGLSALVILFTSCKSTQPRIEQQSTTDIPAKHKDLSLVINTVVDTLRHEPDWLFPIAQCPAKVMLDREQPIRHFAKDCAKNPEKCLANCQQENGSACYGLALLLQEQQPETETKYSEALFSRSCELGITSGCTNRAAGMLHLENNSDSDLKCIANTFAKTCAKNDPWGCTMSGLVLSQGIGCDRDIDKALQILPKACVKNSQDPACQFAKNIQQQILETK